MARGRGRPPKPRPPGASSSDPLSFDTNSSFNSVASRNTQEGAVPGPILLGDFIVNSLSNSPLISGGSSIRDAGLGVPGIVAPIDGSAVTVAPVPIPSIIVNSSVPEASAVAVEQVIVNSSVPDASTVVVEQVTPEVVGSKGPSWSEVVQTTGQAGMSLFLHEDSVNSTEVDIDFEDFAEEIKLWQHTLVGNVIGMKQTLKQMSDFISKNWGHLASPIVQYYQAMNSILREGPWRLGSCSMVLKQWSPIFSAEMEKVSVVPVWVLFHGLDPYLWSDVVLNYNAKSKLSFASIMVEVDVSKPLVTYVYEVEYEWVPHYFSGCGKLGHVLDKCKWNKKKVSAERVVAPVSGPSPSVGAPQTGDVGSESQLLGDTSGPHQASPNPLSGELGSLVQGNGEHVLDAVKHSGCTVPGSSPPLQEGPFSLVKGSASSLRSLISERISNPLVTVNSFEALNQVCADILDSQNAGKFGFFGILETRVKEKKAFKLASSRFRAFGFLANYEFHRNGRIWVLWNPCTVSITPLCVQSQYLHCQIAHHSSGSVCHVTFVYGDNDSVARQSLWSGLRTLSHSAQNWLLVGDFNVVRDSSERISSSLPNLSDILDFNACLLACGLEDMSGAGCDFTWTNNQDGQARVWYKLDRALVNPGWLDSFPSSTALFLPSDPWYHSLVYDAWQSSCSGTAMFKFFFKLKQVRGALWCLHRNVFSNIQSRIMAARTSLEACQVLMQSCSSDEGLIAQEQCLRATYMKLLAVELSILRQKAKADGIVLNDCPTKYFYARVNERRQAQIIGAINDHQGVVRRGLSEVAEGFVEYYKCLLGYDQDVQDLDNSFFAKGAGIRGDSWSSLVRPVLDMEIDIALASIKHGKSPGPDGFSSAFFTASWDVIKHYFRACVHMSSSRLA
ncbi:hypothetical protein RND81_07G119000 [Saponaria officinalis]|uniref:DUF4283 domain-containing protein n=1 Tax=Saponaria officinalis TaxID=3572 RepID=A0AAW1JS07_SAPOF